MTRLSVLRAADVVGEWREPLRARRGDGTRHAIMVVVVLLAVGAAGLAGATRLASAHHVPGMMDEPRSGLEPIG